jgi:hypothetical protein
LRSADGLIITLMILGISVTWNSNILDLYLRIPTSSTYVSKGPHTRSNKFVQQHVVQQETVSIHDTISLRKLQSLGKCNNENMSKAACLTIILAYVTEEETIYRKRKRSIWTKDWLKRRSEFEHSNLITEFKLSSPLDYKNYLRMRPSTFSELLELITVWESMMNWWCDTTARKHVHTHFKLLRNLIVAQQNSNLFENRQTAAQTVKPHHTRSNSLRNSLCYANCLTVCGALKTSRCI